MRFFSHELPERFENFLKLLLFHVRIHVFLKIALFGRNNLGGIESTGFGRYRPQWNGYCYGDVCKLVVL